MTSLLITVGVVVLAIGLGFLWLLRTLGKGWGNQGDTRER